MPPTPPYRHRKPWYRTAVHWLRRGHLFAGLLLLPWVFLYGITAFLFNHPTVFSDQPAVSFTGDDQAGTPLESLPSPAVLAQQVVAGLNQRQAGTSHTLVQPEAAKYSREFAFATVKTESDEISVLVELNGNGGSIRSRPLPPVPVEETRAPFAVGRGDARPVGKKGGAAAKENRPAADGLFVPAPLHERIRDAVPTILVKHGFATGEVTVTSIPDLVFLMDAHGQTWRVTWNAQTGRVSGKPADEPQATEISTRRFLLRLHTAHGYPSEEGSARWYWALVVDAMAFIMVFWGVSGLFMWWQIKAMRKIGGVLLLVSIAGATWVGYAMHTQMTGG